MLGLDNFYELFATQEGVPGVLIACFLASFKPIGEKFGIPGVDEASNCAASLLQRVAPDGALVGYLSWLTGAVFLPYGTWDQAHEFVRRLHGAASDDDLELAGGDWAEIRFAVGAADVRGDEPHGRDAIETAARQAERDQRRYPAEWSYPVVLLDERS